MKQIDLKTNVDDERFKLNGLYLRLWHAGFRWLYIIDAIAIFLIMVLVNLIRFGTQWPEKAEMWVGVIAATFIFQIIFYFGGLYEKQVRLGQRMWFSQVAAMTLIGLLIIGAFTLPTGRYPIPRANLPVVGVLIALAASGSRELSRKLRTRRFGPPKVILVGSHQQTELATEHLNESDRGAVVVAKLNEEIEKNVELNKNNGELKREDIAKAVAADLTDVEKEKFNKLAEEVEYSNEEDFTSKVKTIKESYFGKKEEAKSNDIDDVAVSDGSVVEPADLTNSMAAYSAAISKTKDIKLSK